MVCAWVHIIANASMVILEIPVIKVWKYNFNFKTVVKTPFCINGMSDDNDNCKCFSGWNGKLCEIKLCDNCTNGVCRDDGSCSCNVLYKTTDENSGNNCDSIVSCEVFSPFCETCNNSICTKCYDGYFLSDRDKTCSTQ